MADTRTPTPLLSDGDWTEVTRWLTEKLIPVIPEEAHYKTRLLALGRNATLRAAIRELALAKSAASERAARVTKEWDAVVNARIDADWRRKVVERQWKPLLRERDGWRDAYDREFMRAEALRAECDRLRALHDAQAGREENP